MRLGCAVQGKFREAAEAYGRAGAARDAEHMRALLEQHVEEAAAMVLSTAGISGCVTPSLQPDLTSGAGQSARLATATCVRRACLLVLNRQSLGAELGPMRAILPGVADGPCSHAAACACAEHRQASSAGGINMTEAQNGISLSAEYEAAADALLKVALSKLSLILLPCGQSMIWHLLLQHI